MSKRDIIFVLFAAVLVLLFAGIVSDVVSERSAGGQDDTETVEDTKIAETENNEIVSESMDEVMNETEDT